MNWLTERLYRINNWMEKHSLIANFIPGSTYLGISQRPEVIIRKGTFQPNTEVMRGVIDTEDVRLKIRTAQRALDLSTGEAIDLLYPNRSILGFNSRISYFLSKILPVFEFDGRYTLTNMKTLETGDNLLSYKPLSPKSRLYFAGTFIEVPRLFSYIAIALL